MENNFKSIIFFLIIQSFFSCSNFNNEVQGLSINELKRYLEDDRKIIVDNHCGLITNIPVYIDNITTIDIDLYIDCGHFKTDIINKKIVSNHQFKNKIYLKNDSVLFKGIVYNYSEFKNQIDHNLISTIDDKFELYIIKKDWKKTNNKNFLKLFSKQKNKYHFIFEYRNKQFFNKTPVEIPDSADLQSVPLE